MGNTLRHRLVWLKQAGSRLRAHLACVTPSPATTMAGSGTGFGRSPLMRAAHAVAALALPVALTLGLATHARNADYRDEIGLWTVTTRDSPEKARPWNNLGYAYQLAGRRDEAIAAYRRALSLDRAYEKPKANLLELGEAIDPR